MTIVDLIYRMYQIVTEIRKCESVYFYCDDSKQVYIHLLRSMCALQNPSMIFHFAKEELNEFSDAANLKDELLILYGAWKDEFIRIIYEYHQSVESIAL